MTLAPSSAAATAAVSAPAPEPTTTMSARVSARTGLPGSFMLHGQPVASRKAHAGGAEMIGLEREHIACAGGLERHERTGQNYLARTEAYTVTAQRVGQPGD